MIDFLNYEPMFMQTQYIINYEIVVVKVVVSKWESVCLCYNALQIKK